MTDDFQTFENEPYGAPMPDSSGGELAGAGFLIVLRLLAAGVLGALIGGAIWTIFIILTETMYSLLAIVVGIVVGAAVLLGSGGRKGILPALYAAVLTAIALVLSEYFIARHFALADLAGQGYKGNVPLFLPLDDMVELVKQSIEINPRTPLFWLAGVAGAFLLALRGSTRRR